METEYGTGTSCPTAHGALKRRREIKRPAAGNITDGLFLSVHRAGRYVAAIVKDCYKTRREEDKRALCGVLPRID